MSPADAALPVNDLVLRLALADATDAEFDSSVRAIHQTLNLQGQASVGTVFSYQGNRDYEAGLVHGWGDPLSTCRVYHRYDEVLGVAYVEIAELLPGLTASRVAEALSLTLPVLTLDQLRANYAAQPDYKSFGRLLFSQGAEPDPGVLEVCAHALASEQELMRRAVAHVASYVQWPALLQRCAAHLDNEPSQEAQGMFLLALRAAGVAEP
jgi:hypothetical protein